MTGISARIITWHFKVAHNLFQGKSKNKTDLPVTIYFAVHIGEALFEELLIKLRDNSTTNQLFLCKTLRKSWTFAY